MFLLEELRAGADGESAAGVRLWKVVVDGTWLESRAIGLQMLDGHEGAPRTPTELLQLYLTVGGSGRQALIEDVGDWLERFGEHDWATRSLLDGRRGALSDGEQREGRVHSLSSSASSLARAGAERSPHVSTGCRAGARRVYICSAGRSGFVPSRRRRVGLPERSLRRTRSAKRPFSAALPRRGEGVGVAAAERRRRSCPSRCAARPPRRGAPRVTERVVDLPAELRGRVAVELGRLLRAPRAMLRGLDRQGRSGQ